MLSCGSLAQVREERTPTKPEMATRSPKGTASPRSRKRRSRRSRSRRCGGDDPLSIVGSDINVRDHPLAALERRDDDDKSRPRKEGRNYIEERLQRLQGQIYKGDRSLSPCTVASVRKRGLDEIGTLLSASSSLSDGSRRGCSSDDDKGRKLERRAIKRIHGRSKPAPACPTCKGELTYLCLSKDGHSVNVREAQEEGDSSKEILQRLLPPLCTQCQTQMVYEQSKCKQSMIDNFNAWIEGGRDARGDEDEDEGEEGYSHNRRIAKLIVVNCSPADETQKGEPEELGVQVSASFGSSHADITPRLSNRSERSEEAPFEFVASAAPAPLADENAAEGDDEDCEKEEAALPVDETEAAAVEKMPPEQAEAHDSHREGISPDYFSDDDPFSELGDEEVDDDATAFEPVPGVLSGGSDQQLGSTESIALIQTESEERTILESHSTTKEIATVQIAKELIRGHEITPSQCERCRMPMMANDEGEAECVTCPAIGRKARRIASKKRRASNASSGADEHAAAIGVDEDGVGNACQQVNLNALEEGLAGSTSHGESVSHSVEEGPSLDEQPTSSSIGLNPIDSDRSDYWVRHSASPLQVARNAERTVAQQSGASFPFSFSSHSSASQSESGHHLTANEEGEQLSQTDSYHRSLSEGSHPEEGLNPTAVGEQLNRSLSDHCDGVQSSEVSDTRGPSNDSYQSSTQSVASADEPVRQAAEQVIQDRGLPNLGPSSESSPYQRSPDLSSQCQSDTKEARTTEYHLLYHQPHHCQSNLSSSEVSDYHAPSVESATRCPRSLPSDDMIWHDEFHRCASEPARAYPVQSCSSESSEVKSVEDLSNSHGEAHSDPLLVLANAATAQNPGSDVEIEEAAQENRVDSVQNCKRGEICVEGSEASDVSETRAPAANTSKESPSNPSPNDVSTENNSLRARIARLAESLKEVAEQLPPEENAVQRQHTPVVPPKQESLASKEPRESLSHSQTSPIGDRDRQDRDKLLPIPSPVAIKQDIATQSPHQRKVVEERLPSVESTRHNSLQKHEGMLTSQSSPAMRNMFSPINVGADRKFYLFDDWEGKERQSSKERKERRSSKGKRRRSHAKQKMMSPDPPGRRMDTFAVDARDPDDDHHAQSTRKYASSKPKRRHGKPSRDPPPGETAGPRVIAGSVFDGVTPKARGKTLWVDRTPRNNPSTEVRRHRSPEKSLPRESVQLEDAPSWDNEEVREPLQTSNSFGDSSLGDLFKTIDEIEDDFQTIVASMPGSEEHTISTESTMSCDDKHSLVEIHLNNASSFESSASGEITDVVQRMHRIKTFIAHMDSADDEDESRCSGQISEGEMSELLSKLTSAAESLRAIEGDWED